MQELLDQLGVTLPAAIGVTALVLAIMILTVVLLQTLKKKRPEPPPPVDLSIDIGALGESGPPPVNPAGESAILELYHIPVRLAGLVVAPTGRGGTAPDDERLGELLDAVVPGLAAVLRVHRPQIIRWEPQLSTQGFSTTLFANVHLPGDKGRGTPWCAVSGRCEAGEQKLLLGLICRAAVPNSLAHVSVQRESQWLDVLRVHS